MTASTPQHKYAGVSLVVVRNYSMQRTLKTTPQKGYKVRVRRIQGEYKGNARSGSAYLSNNPGMRPVCHRGAKLNEFESIERQAIVMGNPDIEDDVEPVE